MPDEMILPHKSIPSGLVTVWEVASVRIHAQACSFVAAKLVDTFVCVRASCDIADEWMVSGDIVSGMNTSRDKCEQGFETYVGDLS